MAVLDKRMMGKRECVEGLAFKTRNTEGERILEFGDAVEMVMCGTRAQAGCEDSSCTGIPAGEIGIWREAYYGRRSETCVQDSKTVRKGTSGCSWSALFEG